MASDFDALKDVPGYRMIMKAILKSQIQHLVEQLSKETEEESVILTASMSDGMLCHLGSNSGKIFLDNHEELKSQFLNFCLKEKHAKEQAASAVEDQLSFHNPSPGLVKSVTTHSGRRVKPVSKDIPLASTPHGRRYQPYSTRKPSKTATSTITSPTSPSSSIEIQQIAVNEQSEIMKGTPQKENDMSMSNLSTVKVEPMDSGYLALPETIEGYRIVQNETEPDANDNDSHGESLGDSVTPEQTGQSESASAKTKKQLTGAGAQLGVDSVGPNASNNAIKSESFSEFDMDASKPDSENDESLDMSGLEQPGPSGISASGTSPAEQRNINEAGNRQWNDLVDEDPKSCDESPQDSERDPLGVYLHEISGLIGEKVREESERGDGELYYLVEHLSSSDIVKVITTLASVLFSEDELIDCSRTGKNTHKCIGGARPPLDKQKLKRLERIVLNKTQISQSLFNEKLANYQKVLRKKRQIRMQRTMKYWS